MRVKLIRNLGPDDVRQQLGPETSYSAAKFREGDLIDVTPEEADRLTRDGLAVAYHFTRISIDGEDQSSSQDSEA